MEVYDEEFRTSIASIRGDILKSLYNSFEPLHNKIKKEYGLTEEEIKDIFLKAVSANAEYSMSNNNPNKFNFNKFYPEYLKEILKKKTISKKI